MDILIILSGIIILLIGGDSLVKGAISIAGHLKVSKVLVSSVIVGFGTSMPEMTVSLEAMLAEMPEIAIGNVIGSNIANILLILGIAAIISPFSLKDNTIKRDVIVMLIATAFLTLFGVFGSLNFVHGIVMLCMLISYIVYSYKEDKNKVVNGEDIVIEEGFKKEVGLMLSLVISIVGMVLLIVGSTLFLKGSVSLADKFNISKEIVGLGIVALGSCLPELTTTIIASYKKQGDIVIAGIVGSNIFNILSIVGVISLIKRIEIPHHIIAFDLWLFLGTTLILSIILLKGMRFRRSVGYVFLSSYVLYIYTLFFY